MPDFFARPGLLFVLATILPLVSFLLILLASGAWCLARKYRETLGEGPYRFFGGDKPGKLPAYVALAAIFLAFVCCATGFVLYYLDHHKYLHDVEHAEHQIEELEHQLHETEDEATKKQLETNLNDYKKGIPSREREWQRLRKEKWQGTLFTLASIRPSALVDKERGTKLEIGYYIDSLATVMFVMVTFIATLIHLFSIGYMSEEEEEIVEDHYVHGEDGGHYKRRGRFGRFFMYLSLFCFSMLNLILADNLFQVFVSWELVGVCSFLLIGFYFERQSASNAANKAFITNRVGDAGFILGLLIVFGYIGTFNFEGIFTQLRAPIRDAHNSVKTSPVAGRIVRGEVLPLPEEEGGGPGFRFDEKGSQVLLFGRRPHVDVEDVLPTEADGSPRFLTDHGEPQTLTNNPGPADKSTMPYWMLVAAGLGIFLGCVGKSAQFPLQVWLPDAMEGPTPVSALIHAATMVAAGVYLVGRCYPMFTPDVLLVIAYTGAITLFVAASIAIVMTDIKKVLAYSTVSQLGYMMLALGVGGWVAGLFHLVTHAFFKALLFLGSGSVIYGCHHEQDMSKMGGLYPKMKITALTMLAGVLAIAGIPLFSGWYSKDSILAHAIGFAYVHPQHILLFLLPLFTAGITTFYMFRMWFLTFTGEPRDEHVYEHAHESPWTMTTPLILLAICSIAIAWGWPVWDAKSSWLEHKLHTAQHHAVKADFGHVASHHETWPAEAAKPLRFNERHWAHELHDHAGFLALFMVAIGIVFAVLTYYSRVLDPAEAKEQFPGVHAFLVNKWYFDHLYSVCLVRPAIIVARAFRSFDLNCIDGLIHAVSRGTVQLARGNGRFDNGFIDWLVNLTANVTYSVGARLRAVQTGFLRSYVLFLVLAAIGCFVVLSYFVAMATAG